VMLGRAYLRANNIENLGAMTATARQWFPANVDVEALRATYFFRSEDYGRAVEMAREVIARDPRNTLALAVLSSPMVQEVTRK
jgi:cytochrome c-type biogenesis protein CcmH/NrfG